MKVIGKPKIFLVMEIERGRKNKIMTLEQPTYIEKCLIRLKMKDSKPQKMPMITRQARRKEFKSKESERTMWDNTKPKAPYREAIGSLLYLGGRIRPDIFFAVNNLAKRQTLPTEDDWKDVKWVFRYLRATANLDIFLELKMMTQRRLLMQASETVKILHQEEVR